MSETERCIHCGKPVRVINYALGPEVMHIDPAVGFPTEHKGTAWRYCRQRVAQLPPKPVDGLTDVCPTPGYGGRHTAVGAGAISPPYMCHGCGAWFTLHTPAPAGDSGGERGCVCDEPEKRAARHPFVVNPACPAHAGGERGE